MQNIQLRSIAEIMKEYSPVYPESKKWEDTIEYLLNEHSEKETIEILIQELARDGKFREPILALQNDEGDKYIGDGTHRLVAAYVAGYEEILTSESSPAETISLVGFSFSIQIPTIIFMSHKHLLHKSLFLLFYFL